MQSFKTIFFNSAFALNCLLLFLLFFEQQFYVPVWLQVAGRMHPLVLHFPIVLLLLGVLWEAFHTLKNPYTPEARKVGDGLLLGAALTAALSALMGLLLSKEEGYQPDSLVWHKWSGVFLSLLSLALFAFRGLIRRSRVTTLGVAVASVMLVVVTGHQGANITHGEDFLFAPTLAKVDEAPVALEDAYVYADMVKPILQAKCTGCHNTQKAKGNLIMETEALLLKGGKNGPLWDTTESDLGLLMRRIHLPAGHKKHMPPQGKPQLTEEEIQVLYHWVKSGASFTTKVAELPPSDSLRLLAVPLFETNELENYSFAAADETIIKRLNNDYRTVLPLAAGSPALSIEFFSAARFTAKDLKELLPVKNQVVSLNLNKMPVKDGDLKNIGQFTNLRKLNLSFTHISGAALQELGTLKDLKQLALSGTQVKAGDLEALATLPRLTHLYLWNTSVLPQDTARIRRLLKVTTLETGFKGDTVTIKLNAPLIANEAAIIEQPEQLKLKHYIKGVSIRYTTDGKEPDSIHAPEFRDNFVIDKNVTIKAKAFREGWISSDVSSKTFYKKGIAADSVQLLYPPDPQYKGAGAATLSDGQKGEANFRDGNWLGFKDQPLEVLYHFKQAIPLSSLTVSSIVDVGSHVMPPLQIEVWGGNQPSALRLLKRLSPPQPSKEKPAYMLGYDLNFNTVTATCFKVVVKPLKKLPTWHNGKGQKAWVFVDEVFLYTDR